MNAAVPQNTFATLEELVSELEFAKAVRKDISTVRRWRHEGAGPKFIRLGASVYHRRSDINDWLRSCMMAERPRPAASTLREETASPAMAT